MTPTQALSERERLFVEAYMGRAKGNATKAAIMAGYSRKTAGQLGYRLLKKVHVCQALEDRVSSDKRVETREEIQAWLTAVKNDPDVSMTNRLRASDQLNKTHGAYVSRIAFENPPPFRLLLDADPD